MRNRTLVGDILQAAATRGSRALVISERIGHLETILTKIRDRYAEGEVITGDTSDSLRKDILKRFNEGRLKILMATFKSIPSIDINGATDLFICSAVKYPDYLAQVMGRILKSEHGRRQPVIHDYRDKPEVLRRSLNGRLRCYRKMGAIDD